MPAREFSVNRLALLAMLLLVVPGIACPVDLTQDDIDFRKEVYTNSNKEQLPYRLYVPLGYDKNRQYPLILWLHGAEARGGDNQKQLTKRDQLATHFWIRKETQLSFPVFVLVPQCPMGEQWSDPDSNKPGKALRLTVEALSKLRTKYSIDPDRIYVGGQAMGGLGVYSLLQSYLKTWAGALVMAAYDNFTDVHAVASVPLWIFQGAQDTSVPVDIVRQMVRQVKKAGGEVRYTEYHKAGQEVWNQAFADPDLLPWLSAQHRAMPAGGQVGTGTSPSTR